MIQANSAVPDEAFAAVPSSTCFFSLARSWLSEISIDAVQGQLRKKLLRMTPCVKFALRVQRTSLDSVTAQNRHGHYFVI